MLYIISFEDASEGQCSRPAADALKAANTARVIGTFFRLDAELAHFMAFFTVRTLIKIKPQEKGRHAIEKRKYRAKRTQYSAPGSFHKKDSD